MWIESALEVGYLPRQLRFNDVFDFYLLDVDLVRLLSLLRLLLIVRLLHVNLVLVRVLFDVFQEIVEQERLLRELQLIRVISCNKFDIDVSVFLESVDGKLILVQILLIQQVIHEFELRLFERFDDVDLALVGEQCLSEYVTEFLQINVEVVYFFVFETQMVEDPVDNFLFRHFVHDLCQFQIRHFYSIFVIVFVTYAVHSSRRRVVLILDLGCLNLYLLKQVLINAAVVVENEVVELIRGHLCQVECLDFRNVLFFSRFGSEDKSDGRLDFFVAL